MISLNKIKVSKLVPLKDTIIVTDMEFGERISSGGLILPNDDMKSAGIRPRWAKVYAIGTDGKNIDGGNYVYISHGRWTRGITITTPDGEKVIRKIDNNDILLVSDEHVSVHGISDKVY
jgi:co-chaperonin GroES (HSP10)